MTPELDEEPYVFITPWLIPNDDKDPWDLPDIRPGAPAEVRAKLRKIWGI